MQSTTFYVSSHKQDSSEVMIIFDCTFIQTVLHFVKETFPQVRTPQQEMDGSGSTEEEYRRTLR